MKITNLQLAPPGGWRYQEPSTGHWAKGITFEQMVGSAARHRINMKLPLATPPYPTLAIEIEAWICSQLTPEDRERHCESAKKVLTTQPGHIFSSVIRAITGRYAVTCGRCMERMGQMNKWGWWGCWKHRDTIIGWMMDEAAGRGHKVSRQQISSLWKAALAEIRRTRKQIAELADQEPD